MTALPNGTSDTILRHQCRVWNICLYIPFRFFHTFGMFEDDVQQTTTGKASLEAKWGEAIGPGAGFVAVPVAFLRLQSRFGLTATDMLVAINMLAHWWNPNAPVFPRTTAIAKRMNCSVRTVQRSLDRLARLGLVARGKDAQGRRTYNFQGLAERLKKELPLSHQKAAREVVGA